MKSINITIDTGNAAFQGETGNAEVARILSDLAQKISSSGSVQEQQLLDVNGNAVGNVSVVAE